MMGRRLVKLVGWSNGGLGNGGCVELRCVALLECRRAGEPSVQVPLQCRDRFVSPPDSV